MQGMLVLACWVMGALQGAILILVPEMMSQGQLSAMQLAIPLSIGTFVFMLCSGRWGKLLDQRHAQQQPLAMLVRWVLLGFLVSQVAFVVLLQADVLQGGYLILALCAARVIHGSFCSAIIPSAQLLLSSKDKKGEKLLWSSVATNIGRITAPLLTFVPVQISYFSLWFIAAVTLCAFVGVCFLKSPKSTPSTSNEVLDTTIIEPSSKQQYPPFSLFSQALLLTICMTAVLISLFSAQLQFSLGPLLLAKFSDPTLASEMTATLLFAASAGALVSLSLLYRPLSRLPKLFLLIISSSLVAGSCLFALQAQLIVAVVLISAALSMAPVWYSALAIHASHHHKARTSAAIAQGHTLGNALGALLGGALLIFGESALFLSFSVQMILIVLAWLIIYQQSQQAMSVSRHQSLSSNSTI